MRYENHLNLIRSDFEHSFQMIDVEELKFDFRLYAENDPGYANALCINCGKKYTAAGCDFSWYIKRCYRCLVNSLDGSSHSSPFAPIFSIGSLVTNILAKSPIPMFKLRVAVMFDHDLSSRLIQTLLNYCCCVR